MPYPSQGPEVGFLACSLEGGCSPAGGILLGEPASSLQTQVPRAPLALAPGTCRWAHSLPQPPIPPPSGQLTGGKSLGCSVGRWAPASRHSTLPDSSAVLATGPWGFGFSALGRGRARGAIGGSWAKTPLQPTAGGRSPCSSQPPSLVCELGPSAHVQNPTMCKTRDAWLLLCFSGNYTERSPR